MKCNWVHALALALALGGGTAVAEDFPWRPVPPRPAAPPASTPPPAPASLDRPVAAGPAAPEPRLLPPRLLFRAQKPDDDDAGTVFRKAAAAEKADLTARLAEPPPPVLLPPVPAGTPAMLPPPEAVPAVSLARPTAAAIQRTSYPAGAEGPGAPVPAGETFRCSPACPCPPPCDGPVCGAVEACPGEPEAPHGGGFYASAEFLLWQFKNGSAPILATTGAAPNFGALGAPGTANLFGGPDSLDSEEHPGGRFTAGYWFDCCQTNGIEADFFFLGQRSDNFTSALPNLSRPFFNIATGMETVEVTSLPGAFRGNLSINAPSQLMGADLDWRHNLCCGCWYRVDFLAGVQWLELREGLDTMEDVTVLPGVVNFFPNYPFAVGTREILQDRFDTRNEFYGARVGLDSEVHRGRWFLDLRTTVALGETHEVVNIGGNEIIAQPGRAPQVFQGGLLALSSNSGHHVRDRFAVVPDVGLKLGYDVTDNARVFVGYDFLFWSNVVRPGDQIDTNVNPRLIPNFCRISMAQCPPNNVTVQRPAFEFHDTSFWAQGVSAGVEVKY